jgi:thiamine biosynthesis lipoprotein
VHGVEVLTAPLEHHALRAMGGGVEIVLVDAPEGLAAWAAAELGRCERSWSRFLPDSELSRCNRSPADVVAASPRLLAAVTRALVLWGATAGRFDPTVLDALVELGYDRTFAEVRDGPPRTRTRWTAVPGAASVTVDVAAGTIVRPAGVHLDLGGVGKGLAADLVAQGLVDRGARGACVAVGGDVRVAGDGPHGGGWDIPVERPGHEDEDLFVRRLRDAAIVTSTTAYRRWRSDGGWVHHLVDPTTATSARTDVAAVVVAAPEAWWAEGLAKAALVAGGAEGATLLRRHGVDGWLLDADGALVARVEEAGS